MSEKHRQKNILRRPVALALVSVGLALTAGGPSVAAVWPFSDDDVAGTASVVDGDTIDIGGQRIRLDGIDAPETAQSCGARAGGDWACGHAAAKALAEMIGKRRVTCRSEGMDKYDRLLGICSADGVEFNAEMVRRGFAWAFVKYSSRYLKEEREARTAGSGIWQGVAEPAWVYREKRWKVVEGDVPKGCAIKGNITENGHIYHMPWSPWYGRVRVDANRGERWFCSESEAQSAGWRSAGLR